MNLLSNVKQARRVVLRSRGFSTMVVVILATGICATAVMYTMVRSVLLRELPLQDPDRLVWMYNTRTERDRAPLSLLDLEDYRQENNTLSSLAPFINWTTNLTGNGDPERLEGVRVSGRFFDVLGTTPYLGRLLRPEDEEREEGVAVVTHGLWLRRFGGDATIIGQRVMLNGAPYNVVGVLPPRFLFPFREAEIAVPISLRTDPRRADRGSNFLRVIARLAPNVTLAQADADLDIIAQRLQRLYPAENARKIGISLYPLHAEIVRDYRSMLWMLFGSVGVLFLVACVNLANLMLVRSIGRRAEFALRRSLGASRASIVVQIAGEMTVLAAISAIAALALADLSLGAWRAWGPADFPQIADAQLDRHVVLFVAILSGSAALGCALVPAWLASRDTALLLRESERTSAGSRTQHMAQRLFVSAQIASATVLLIGMLLMMRGYERLAHVAPGFTPGHALSVQLSLPPATYSNRDALVRFYEALRVRLKEISGVEAAGAVSLLPLSGLLSTTDVAFADRPAPPPDAVPQAHLRIASAEYFDAAGITVIEGRAFSEPDSQSGRPVAMVSRTFAERHWPQQNAVGKAVQIVQTTSTPWLEIVGVVSDVKQFTLDGPETADLYVPLHQMPAFQAPLIAARMSWVIRARSEARLAEAVRSAVSDVDPGVAASSVRTLESIWLTSLGSRRANVRLLQAFGNVALILSALGVYGVAAFAARMRRRELAIRAALGAGRRQLTFAMVGHDLPPIGFGLVTGLAVAFVLAPRLFGSAFQTSPRDGMAYAIITGLLALVAGLASYIPARSAGTADPTEALKG